MSLLEDSSPPYLQLARRLRASISSGEFAVGDKLPGNRELGEKYGVSQGTVLSALRELRREGLVVAQQGRGTFVRATPDQGAATRSTEFTELLAQLDAIQATLRQAMDRIGELEQRFDRLEASSGHQGS